MAFISRGFHGRPRQSGVGLIPPGQYVTDDFPVLTAGQTPRVRLETWDFTITDQSGTQSGDGLGRVSGTPPRGHHRRYQLRDQMDKVGNQVDRSLLDTLARGITLKRASSLRSPKPTTRRTSPWPTYATAKRGSPSSSTAKRSRPNTVGRHAAHSPSVLLEEREVGAGTQASRPRSARLLGVARL